MAETPENTNAPLFTNPLETYPGLTIDNLNKYLPAIRTVEDITLTKASKKNLGANPLERSVPIA